MPSDDLVILGGGLAGGLIARALARRRPEVRFRLVERAAALGGNHVWSFFDGDVAVEDRWLVEDLVAWRWPAYDVAFPAHRRTIAQGYNSITSERFDAALRAELGERVVQGEAVEPASPAPPPPSVVPLPEQARGGIIDARGSGDLGTLDLGWQKFVGMSLMTAAPHRLERPMVMDATVEQRDGYRFVYVLPTGARELFIEDTYYSDTAELDVEAIKSRILYYASGWGWDAEPGERFETGVLPVVLSGDFEAYWRSTGAGAKAGMRAGLFHPTTGYSLPDAVRLAALIAEARELSAAGLAWLTHDFARKQWGARGFYRALNRMLFRAAAPDERYRVLERFYRLSPALIGRFYAGRSTLADKARVLAGRPPVPVGRALRAAWR